MSDLVPTRETSRTRSDTGYALRLTRRLIVLMAALMVSASLAVAVLTLQDFNRLLTPELERKARLDWVRCSLPPVWSSFLAGAAYGQWC